MLAEYPMPTLARTALLGWLCTLAFGGGCHSGLVGDGDGGVSPPDLARGPHCDRVFVLDNKSNLARFDPETLLFEDVGRLRCPLVDVLSPTSLAVSRGGELFVNYPNGDLLRMPLDIGSCAGTQFFFGYGGSVYGMSFAANMPRSAEETLYASRQVVSPYVFGIMNLGGLELGRRGYLPNEAVLAGSGAGDLWAVSRGAVTTVARVDLTDETRITGEFPLAELGDTRQRDSIDLAAAVFREDLWLFVGAGGPSTVYRLDLRSRSLTRVMADAGRRVVAATAPTCSIP